MTRLMLSFIFVLILLVLPVGSSRDDGRDLDRSIDTIAPSMVAASLTSPAGSEVNLALAGHFTENMGQIGTGAGGFLAQGGRLSIVLGDGHIAYHLPPMEKEDFTGGVVVRVNFFGCNPVSPVGVGLLDHHTSYLIGNDESRWVLGAHNFREILYEDLWDGVDARFRFEDGQFKYDFVIHPRGRTSSIVLDMKGADDVKIDTTTGDLLIKTIVGTIRDQAPVATQGEGALENYVPVSFTISDDGSVGFDLGAYNPAELLVIDPGIDWCTYLGGNNLDFIMGLEVNSEGDVFVGGWTHSTDFPTTPGAYKRTKANYEDLFVCKVKADGSGLLYSTFIGGSSGENAFDLDIDDRGAAYMVGETSSSNFPTTGNAIRKKPDAGDLDEGFLFKLSPAGSSLEYSTYIGGNEAEYSECLEVQGDGTAYVCGMTNSPDFPTTVGVYDRSYDPEFDIFCMKVNTISGAIIASTFIGSSDREYIHDMALDSSGNPFLTGYTWGSDFPTTGGAYDTTPPSGYSSYVTKLKSDLSDLVYSTWVGGEGFDVAHGIYVSDIDEAFVVGRTNDTDFPTTGGAFCETYNTAQDGTEGFVIRFTPSGDDVVFSSLLGGSGSDEPLTVCVDYEGFVYVAGATKSSDFPTTPNALTDKASFGWVDAFLTVMNPSGSILVYSTLFNEEISGGGSRFINQVVIERIVVDEERRVVAAGWTEQSGLPTTPGAMMEEHQKTDDGFILRLDPLVSYPPEILEDLTPSEVSTDEQISYEVSVRDDIAVMGAYVDFWYHDGQLSDNISMQLKTGMIEEGIWYCMVDVRQDVLSNLSYRFNITDCEGYWIQGPVKTIKLIDRTKPTIEVSSEQEVTIGDVCTILVKATDNAGVQQVKLTFWYGKTGTPQTMTVPAKDLDAWGNGTYEVALTIPRGFWKDLYYTITVIDPSGNSIETYTTTVKVLDLQPPTLSDWTTFNLVLLGMMLDFSVNAEDNGALAEVHVLVKLGNLETVNYTMEGDGNYSFSLDIPRHMDGMISFWFSAVDTAGNWNQTPQMTVVPMNDPPRLVGITEWVVKEGTPGILDLDKFIMDDNDPVHNILMSCDDKDVTMNGHKLMANFDVWKPNHEITITLMDLDASMEFTLELRIEDVNDPPTNPVILSPQRGEAFEEGFPITFALQVEDSDVEEGQELEIVWESNLQGVLWSGDTPMVFSLNDLIIGNHIINVTVSDGEYTKMTQTLVTIEKADGGDGGSDEVPGIPASMALLALLVTSGVVARLWPRPGKS